MHDLENKPECRLHLDPSIALDTNNQQLQTSATFESRAQSSARVRNMLKKLQREAGGPADYDSEVIAMAATARTVSTPAEAAQLRVGTEWVRLTAGLLQESVF